MSPDTRLHELCKGFGALMSRSKQPSFPEEAAALNERGNLPLHAACSFQATQEVVDTLLKAYPGGASHPNAVGNLPIHQAAMWQAPAETVELLLRRHTDGASVRNQYGSLPLHMAASNQASPEVVRLLIDAYPDALHLQNDDGMTPLDLALADESASEAVVAMLEGRPPPPELTRRQRAEKLEDRADALERKLASLRDSHGGQNKDLREALSCLRRLADRFPHSLYAAGVDPNELEMTFGEALGNHSLGPGAAERILLEAVKKRSIALVRSNSNSIPALRDRVEDLLHSIVGLDHLKSQVRGLRRTTELCDLRESLLPPSRGHMAPSNALVVHEESIRPEASHMVFVGNPGTGKTAVARLLAKAYHELGLLRKPKFLEVERMDLVARDPKTTSAKTREVLEEAKGGILFIDEAYTLGIASKRSRSDTGLQSILELAKAMEEDDDVPLVILSGFPVEMQQFLTTQPELRKQFPLTFEFPDYTCFELAQIFTDLCDAKGFDLEESLSVAAIGNMLERETTREWRSERNGRVCEMLLAGARTEMRKRMRAAAIEDNEDFDPHLIVLEDVENVVRSDFK